ncbi:hypothetical protein JQ597_23965 [Bradyrhizobium sp. AUGA SZCCT0177]|uniref:hypothetical protein n=1 Tax=Bradyrhizobium sp. AUGA SZCCT0177 TaxID=2807665 RepID=UPI001BAB6CA3|nr:hypothetical protein [Bradyrhizobium sp. AUGA SZCCT0177]MBR1285107.1 hypothetical protein [Bradyrhizobium sp. AUGA SZCCT0177]
MASRRTVRVASLAARWVRPWLIQAMGCDWRRIHADRDGIPVRELRIAQKSGWEADRSSITIKIITREATAIGRQKRGGCPMRVGIEINFALWGMIICVVIEALQTFAFL